MMSGTAIASQADGNVGYTACATMTITNAEYGLNTNSAHVYSCKSGYAVANANTSCTAFTTDSNCRKLGSTGAYCGQCWYAYYFTTTTCTLGANLMAFAGLVLAALYMM